jgi:hypothetical protein
MAWDETIRSVKRNLDRRQWIDWEGIGGEIVVTLLAGHGRCPCAVAKRCQVSLAKCIRGCDRDHTHL